MRPAPPPPSWVTSLSVLAVLASSAHAVSVLNLIGDLNAYRFGIGPNPVPSQLYADFPAYDCMVVEDFRLTASLLHISEVSALFFAQTGFQSFSAVQGYELNIYSSEELAAQHLAGDLVHRFLPSSGASVTQVVDPATGDEYGMVTLEVSAQLPAAGVYWIGIAPRAQLSAVGDFRLAPANSSGTTNTAGENNARWNNPGQGFGGPPSAPLEADFAYAVNAVPEPSLPLLSLMALATLTVQRQRGDRSLRVLPEPAIQRNGF